MDPNSSLWLYFRVLAEPNPAREGERKWRIGELAQRASALSGRTHQTENVAGTVRSSLQKRKFAVAENNGRKCTLWSLTEEARLRNPVLARATERARAK